MRDIRPQKQPYKKDPRPEKSADDFEAAPKPKKQNRLSGSHVPVSATKVEPPFARTPVENPEKLKPKRSKKVVEEQPPPKQSLPLKPKKTPPAKPSTQGGGKRRQPRIGRRERTIFIALLVLTLAAGALAAVIFLPTAKVELVLRTAPLLVDENLLIEAGSTSTGTIPGTVFSREHEGAGEYAVQGVEVIGEKATGSVQLVNRTFDEQKIKERSRLVTADGELFYMLKSATIPGDSRVTVQVEAAEAGEAGNIEPQRLDFAALAEADQQLVFAESTTAFSGGSGETVALVTEDDLAAAQEAAGTAARSAVEQSIQQELAEGWVVLDKSWTAEVVAFETPVAAGERTQVLPYSAKTRIRVLAYQASAVEEQLKAALESRLSEEFILFPGPLSYTAEIKDIDLENETTTIAARVTHMTIPDLSIDTLRSKIIGRSESETREYLTGLPGVRAVSVDLWPFWARSLPRIENRISIDFVSERQP